MATMLLIVIYIAFLGRGMPDSITGVAWTKMFVEFEVAEGSVSIVTVTISLSTAVISLFCARLIARFGTFKVALAAMVLLSLTLFGYFLAPSFIFVCLLALPLGIGAGLLDNALNDYMTAHYSAVYLNVMHGVYGIGAALSPLLVAFALERDGSWRSGYLFCFFAMLVITVIVAASYPLWRKSASSEAESGEAVHYPLTKQLGNRAVQLVLLCVFFGNAIEALFVAYGGTYLVGAAGIGEAVASKIIMVFCLGMGFGRMFAGFLSIKVACRKMMSIFAIALVLPAVVIFFNLPTFLLYVVFALIGFLSGPIYPLTIYIAPELFGKDRAHAVLGTQIAVAYSGFVISQMLMSFIVSTFSIAVFTILLAIFSAALLVFVLLLSRVKSDAKETV